MMDVHKVIEHSFIGLASDIIAEAQNQYKALLEWKSSRKSRKFDEVSRRFRPEHQSFPRLGLFGTSGIRGLFNPDVSGHPVYEFVEKNELTPKLAYFAGRAVAQMMTELKYKHAVRVVMDVRRSSAVLAMSVMKGLLDQNMDVYFGGIAPTPVYNLDTDYMTIVVTASHNPVEYNGLKFFWQGRPVVIKMERQVEYLIAAHADLDAEGFIVEDIIGERGRLSLVVAELERMFFERLQNLSEMGALQVTGGQRLKQCFLPLDLAYGSAACVSADSGRIDRISPVVALFLSLGIPVIGYGCIRHPDRTNRRIGAAYAYGEAEDQPQLGELAKFARGLFGYGGDVPRVVFLPETVWSENPFLKNKLKELIEKENVQNIPVAYPEFSSQILVVPIDNTNNSTDILTEIESELMRRRPLPGLMVDCDADRILVTAPEIAKSDIPYLTGDALIRFFAETSPPGKYSEIVYTVESSIALEKALRRIQHRFRQNGDPCFDIKVVTVGDRAIIDYMLDRSSGRILGGEPSGHIIFGEFARESDLKIIDDPFITYIRLLQRLQDERFDLDTVIRRMYRDVPELYCARKPDAKGDGKGITLREKQQLELWRESVPGKLSDYARRFVPAYIKMFSEMYAEAFSVDGKLQVIMTDLWKDLVAGRYRFQPENFEVIVAEISYSGAESERLRATLHIDRRAWAGPDMIWISFYLEDLENQWVKMGEGVFRNSGTSPKNAGYNKLWYIHPNRNIVLSDGQLRDALDRLAERRTQWTNKYILTVLRSS